MTNQEKKQREGKMQLSKFIEIICKNNDLNRDLS